MKKLSLVSILLAGCIVTANAQNDLTPATPAQPTPKMFDQYVGVQLNGLIRQVFNFNNSTSSTEVNPYLLTYSINSRKSGWGIRLGAGYNYASTSNADDIHQTTTTDKLTTMQFRLGVDKLFQLSEKWSAGAGVDVVYSSNDDHTTVVENGGFGGPGYTTDTKTTSDSYGAGPMAWLRYGITPHILIGTEASFYYTNGTQKQTIVITDPGNPNTTNPDPIDTKVGNGTFNSPVVFYITVKF